MTSAEFLQFEVIRAVVAALIRVAIVRLWFLAMNRQSAPFA